MSTPSSSSSSSIVGSSVGILSTRDSILQRSGRSGQTMEETTRRNTNGTTSTTPYSSTSANRVMECFESADPSEPQQTTGISRSDRSLLAQSSVSSTSKKGSSTSHPTNEDVEIITTRPSVAFQTFAGALYRGPVNPTIGTFESGSDVISPPSSSLSMTHFESPFVRLQRLQMELNEFSNELKAALTATTSTSTAQSDDAWSTLTTSIGQLQSQLDAVLAQPEVKAAFEGVDGGNAAGASPSPAVAALTSSTLLPQFDNLFSQYVAALQVDPNFRPIEPTPPAAAKPSESTVASAAELAALPKLDQRLAVLEKFIGLNSANSTASKSATPGSLLVFGGGAGSGTGTGTGSTSTTTSASSVAVLPAPDLITSLASLHTQLSSLNPQRLEYLQRSLKGVMIEHEQLALTKSGDGKGAGTSGSADGSATLPAYSVQISHLYSLTQRWDALSLGLPALIARLSSLHTLHASSATLASRIQTLEETTYAIDHVLRQQSEGIIAVQSAASDNMKQMKENFVAMEKRMEEITKKMNQIKSK